jgi:predicted ATPase
MTGLIGREEELSVLTGLIDQVRLRGAAVAVLGEPGIGKSSVLRAAADYGQEAGVTVLRTEGVEAEARLPFAGLHQLLRPALGGMARLPLPQRQALTAAFGAGGDEPPEPFMIALATLNLLAEQADRRPLLLAADDVQWLDPPTRDVLAFIARRLDSDPVVLIGTVRTGYEVPFTTAGLPAVELRGLGDGPARALLGQ